MQKISVLEDIRIETIQTEKQKRDKKFEQSLEVLWDDFKCSSTHII